MSTTDPQEQKIFVVWGWEDVCPAQHSYYLGRNHVQRDNIYLAGEAMGGYMTAPVIPKSGRITQR